MATQRTTVNLTTAAKLAGVSIQLLSYHVKRGNVRPARFNPPRFRPEDAAALRTTLVVDRSKTGRPRSRDNDTLAAMLRKAGIDFNPDHLRET